MRASRLVKVPLFNEKGVRLGTVEVQRHRLTHEQALPLPLNCETGGWMGVALKKDHGQWILECKESRLELLRDVEGFTPEMISFFYSRRELEVLKRAKDKEDMEVLIRASGIANHSKNTSYPSRASAQHVRDTLRAVMDINTRIRTLLHNEEKFISEMERLEQRNMAIIEVDGHVVHVSMCRDSKGRLMELTEQDKNAIADVIRCLQREHAKKELENGGIETKSRDGADSTAGDSVRGRLPSGRIQ